MIVLAGLSLRLLGARGDLWQDELWSISLVAPLTSIDQIFWRINHDNNHYLNSIYQYVVGPDAAPLVQRGLSITLGACTIIAAAAISRGRSAMAASVLLFAVSYPMVHYGSEARGYAGLVLFTLVAVALLERRLDKQGSYGLALAAAILLGFLWHLTMIETVVVLMAWTAWLSWQRNRSLNVVNSELVQVFLPAFLAVLPLGAAMVVGARLFSFRIGGVSSFSLENFAVGYGGMIRYLFGLPNWISDWACIAVVYALVLAYAVVSRDRRTSLYVIGIVGLPALMAVARLPSLEFPRYFIVSGALLLLWAGDVIGRGFDAGGARRICATGILLLVAGSSMASLARFYEYGRGSYSGMVDEMTKNGATTFATNVDFRTGMVVDYFAARKGRQASLITQDKICAGRADWLILEGDPQKQPERVDFDCALAYQRADDSAFWGLSGLGWTLYSRRD
ncbi:hypothetical protein DPM33_16090 [Mesorhizobium hawassense]|uniref:Glycosyltransferase RgtA/B/C/D-like domain-containing protein n=1 Tax=Mesorhizobium hawassense TaxID=1209954 RepID=A0A330HP59_9HYPH|nr:hypothetical protein [Mesorhizobium hawassense]RAZ89710.1 hypothetical protein DPM33_16090 [Mesorhizobium hawassense]